MIMTTVTIRHIKPKQLVLDVQQQSFPLGGKFPSI